jgi:hypothetical protein
MMYQTHQIHPIVFAYRTYIPWSSQLCGWELAEPVLTWQEFETLQCTLEQEAAAA